MPGFRRTLLRQRSCRTPRRFGRFPGQLGAPGGGPVGALVDSGTPGSFLFPVARGAEYFRPERVRPALNGSYGIDRALFFRSQEKNAIAVRFFLQAHPLADKPEVTFGEPFGGCAEEFRDPENIFPGEPDVSRLTRTARAALGAPELQSRRIPAFGGKIRFPFQPFQS